MIAVDTNILVAAHRRDHPLHQRARAVVKQLAEGSSTWSIPLHVLVEFYGKVTHAKIWKTPSSPAQAWDQIDQWLGSPTLRVIFADSRTLSSLRRMCEEQDIRGAKVHDARVAAVCVHNGVRELWSVDRDFSRFPELTTRNPL